MKRYLACALLVACTSHHGAEPVVDSSPPVADASVDSGPSTPTPIKYVVVIVKENHSFDNYFTGFPGAESSMTAKLKNGTTITRQKAPDGTLPGDISHSRTAFLSVL